MTFKDSEIGSIPHNWKVDTMENVLSEIIDYRGKTPKKAESGIETLSAKSVKNGYIDYSLTYFISEETYNKFMVRGFPRKGDILLTTEAPLGNVAKLDRDDVAIAQRLLTLRGNEDILTNDFLMYYLMSDRGKHQLVSRETGTTVTGIKQKEFRKVLIPLPPIEEQEAIGQIFSKLDEKIEVNNKLHKKLEELSHLIFKNWFVDFEFPDENGDPYKSSGGEMVESELGMIPQGWHVGRLSDLVEIRYGKDHKKLTDGNIPVYGSGGVMRFVDTAIYTSESVLIPRKGTLNNVIYVNEPFWSVDTMFYSIMKEKDIARYIYCFLKTKDLASMNTGSAVPSMTTAILNSMPIIIKPLEIVNRFDRILAPIFTQISLILKENEKLVQLRETLLPKLISGEIRVTLRN